MTDFDIDKLRRALEDINYPASKEEIISQLEVESGKEHRWAISFLGTIGDRTYDSADDIVKEL